MLMGAELTIETCEGIFNKKIEPRVTKFTELKMHQNYLKVIVK